MQPPWLRHAANALLVGSALDVALSLADEVLRAALGVEALAAPRGAVAGLVALGMLLALPALAATPRLPLAVFGPLALGTLWLSAGAAPLPLAVAPERVGLVGSAIQGALVAAAWLAARRHHRGRRWLFSADSPPAPAFSWRRTLALCGAALALGPPLAVAYLALSIATSLEVLTQGFVRVDLEGIALGDRRYARDGRDVRLVGMMHIGEEGAYRSIVRSFSREDTVVLAEGVRDREGLLRGGLEYGRAAEALGLQPQRDLRSYLVDPDDPGARPPEWPRVREADVDASRFEPETLEWIAWVGTLWASDDLVAALRAIVVRAALQDPEQWQIVQADILDRRDAHLIGEVERALGDFRHVIVPWGALHLPAVERALLGWGFEPLERRERRLASWRTIAAAVF